MEPVLWPAAFDDPEWDFQVKWDGVRVLAHHDGQRVTLYNKHLHERTRQYPEIVRELEQYPNLKQAILDGEVICLVDGKPHFGRVLQRDWTVNPGTINQLMASAPAAFMVFDLVCWNGEPLNRHTFAERRALLEDVIRPGEAVFPVDSFPGSGTALFETVTAQELEGIVAKQRRSSYLIGKKTDLWRKIKNWKRQPFLVGGYSLRDGRPSALWLGAYLNEDLLYVGKVGVGLTESISAALLEQFPRDPSVPPPFANIPRSNQDSVQWLSDLPVVIVEFLEWTETLKLRHPKIIGFSLQPRSSCVIN